MRLRVHREQWTPFSNALRARKDVETAGIVLAERLHGDEVLLGRHFLLVPDDGYQIRRGDQLRIDPISINRLIRAARDEGLSVITVHTHPGASEPWFSLADDAGDARLMPSLMHQTPGPHGSIVVAGATGKVIGRLWSEASGLRNLAVHVLGPGLETITQGEDDPASGYWFDRQRLALGHEGQAMLRNLHVAVVGLGGTGSIAFTQLAHLGIGTITVVDGDIVERSNLSRIVGATATDVGMTSKVDVAARYAEALGMGTRVRVLRGQLGADVNTSELESCDIVLSCVDRHTPRSLLNRLAYAKAIPLIDMGSAFRVDHRGRVVAGAGRVVVVGPEKRCLACWGHIDPNRLRVEALSSQEWDREVAEGYIEGADEPQPSVVAFNTTIAGAAVIEFLRMTTRFAGADDPPSRLSFDFMNGTVRRNGLAGDAICSICSPYATRVRASFKQ